MNTYKALLIYDSYGNVVALTPNIETVPSGVTCGMIADVPNNMKSVHIDMTTMTPVFETFPEYDFEQMNAQLYFTAVMTDTLIEGEE